MRKNIANQKLAAQLISKTDGSDVTSGTTAVYVTIDAGTQTSIGTATHEGNGCWTIDTGVAGNTNGAHLAFTWVNTSACTVTQNIYPTGFDIGAANITADVQTIKTQAVTCGAGVTVLASVGTAATSTAQTGDSYAIVNGTSGSVATKTVLDTVSGKVVGTLATGTHNPQSGDSYAIVNGASGLVNIKTDTGAIKTKTDFLPSAAAGAAGGVFIAGTNAATSITTAFTANITGNLSGSVGSVTGAVNSVTNGVALAASQHVIVDSGTVTTLTNLPAITTNWLTGTGVDATAVTKIQAGLATPTNITAASGVALAASQHVIVDSGTVTTLTNLPAAPTDWLTGTAVQAAAVTKIQSGLATPTNITAGTLTTVTNLTNAPTNGDLTAVMKTSVTTAATAATPSVTVSDKTGFALAADQAVNMTKIAGVAVNTAAAQLGVNVVAQANIDFGATQKASITAAVPTAAAIGTDAASKVLVTPAQKLVTDASGYPTANLNGDLTATMKSSVTAAVPTAAAIGTDAASKVLVTPAQKIITDGSGNVRAVDSSGAAIAPAGTALSSATWTGTKAGYLDAAVSTRSTYSGGAVASVSAAVTVGTNNDKTGYSVSTITDKTGYSLAVTPPTAVEIVTAIDTTSTSLPAIAAAIADADTEIDVIAGLIGAMTSASGRVEAIMPTEIIKASAGDKYIECFVQLYDSSRVPMNAHDMDGGNYSVNASYNPLERVLPTSNNAGAYYFQIGSTVSGSPATAPDWSTAQTPAQTCLDGDGNIWTNIGASAPSTTALFNGLGITCADEAGAGVTLYSNNSGTPLLRVNECHHWDQSNRPQILTHVATGLYSFWINADSAETDRTIYFTTGWFDKSRFEAGYNAATDHRRVVFQTRIASAPSLTLAEIEASNVIAKEATSQTIKGKTDQLSFSGADVKATLDGETVSVGDKTGFALAIAPPTLAQIEGSSILAKETTSQSVKGKTDQLIFNGSDLKATLDGEMVTVGTNNDKTGYSLTVSPPTLGQIESSTILAKEATVAAKPSADLVAEIIGAVVANLV